MRLESLGTSEELLEGVSPAGIWLDGFLGYLAAHGVFGENLGGFRDLRAHLVPTSCHGQGHLPRVQVVPASSSPAWVVQSSDSALLSVENLWKLWLQLLLMVQG